MKRLISLSIVLCILILCLQSCILRHDYIENMWFSEETLAECLVPDFPVIDAPNVNYRGARINLNITDSEYEDYVNLVYEYLSAQDFKYFGTEGGMISSFFGAWTTYYFEPASELADFRGYDGRYRFVFSDGSLDEEGEVIFNKIVLYRFDTETIDYGLKEFLCNTGVALLHGSDSAIGGFYEYDISYDDSAESGFIDGFKPDSAVAGETVVLRVHPIMDADLDLYVDGERVQSTHRDSDYWEYVFIMPTHHVNITVEISGGM